MAGRSAYKRWQGRWRPYHIHGDWPPEFHDWYTNLSVCRNRRGRRDGADDDRYPQFFHETGGCLPVQREEAIGEAVADSLAKRAFLAILEICRRHFPVCPPNGHW